jgi:hypothetical protein
MEADDVPQAAKKQVSEKVMQNLAKANARRKELAEQRLAERSAEKEATKKLKKVERLKKQLVELVGTQESDSYSSDDQSLTFKYNEPVKQGLTSLKTKESEEVSAPIEEMKEVVVKKVKAPPPAEKVASKPTGVPRPVKERRPPPPPPPPQRPPIEYF